MQLLVGLGNPGTEYDGTRHNIGFAVLDQVAERLGAGAFRRQKSSRLVKATLPQGGEVLLCKPQTFMNLSGDAVWPLVKFYKLAPKDVLVVHDELDLPLGTVRFKGFGGHGGHNGLRHLKTVLPNDFVRLRVGIGARFARQNQIDFVLAAFAQGERALAQEACDRAADAAIDCLSAGLEAATRRLHGPVTQGPKAP